MAMERTQESGAARLPVAAWDTAMLAWLAGAAIVVIILLLDASGLSLPLPSVPLVPLADWISAGMGWFTGEFRSVFRAITWLLEWPLEWFRALLLWIPWPAVILICACLGYLASGWRLAAFCTVALLYIVVTGYWEKTALTLASVLVAVPLSVLFGLLIGIWAFRSRAARRVIEPGLDLMQTIPFFSYLIPILVLFGIGPVVGMTASAIYAIPPMVRNVMLGLERVAPDIVESGLMSGSNRRQLLWWVQLPSSLPTILIGINQTVMAGLSMVVIAAMVGGVSDIGLEVYNTMRQAKFGQSLLAGLVIALLAMITDRVSRGFATRQQDSLRGFSADRRVVIATIGAIVLVIALAAFVPPLRRYPEAWAFYPAGAMNDALDWFTRTFFSVTSALKAWTTYYLMLPLKIGLVGTVRPSFWGFEMSRAVTTTYICLIALLGLVAARIGGWRWALATAVLAMFYYYGTTGVPWLAFMLLAGVLAWQAGGLRVLILTLASLLFILLAGLWTGAMISVELSAVGVLFSFVLGSGLGTWAAINDRVSAFVRPICDTLQTMPIFVFLIPAIMLFLVGEFTALVAIIMYAIVPSIRYTEHGIRNVPAEIVEAAAAMGTTRWQRLWQVQLPLALPEIMLGLNQTIMMALAMVVVAALVGARGLGEQVMIALNQANSGTGIVSGLAIAALAIVTDRIIQSWSFSRKKALGLA
jgi:glycine betaine/proline transport system permease protein